MYQFDQTNKILLPQAVRRCDLSFAYGRDPNNFRKEIAKFMDVQPGLHYYSAKEVEIIMRNMWILTESDFANAVPRINNYHARIRRRKKRQKFGQKK